MKYLIMSDSHGSDERVAAAIRLNKEVNGIFFLGDGERDFEDALAQCRIDPYDSKYDVYNVRGNCDLFSKAAVNIVTELKGVRVFATHGFDQHVKIGYDELADQAKYKECRAALFGHTHTKYSGEINGVKLFNPGSIRSGSYGIMTIENDNIEFEWKNI